MFNPLLGLHEPVQGYRDVNEEQYAQQYGRPVHRPAWDSLTLRLGWLFFRIGERLTRQDPCMEHIHHHEEPCLELSEEAGA